MAHDSNFDKNLSIFFTENREAAIKKLSQNNLKYKESQNKILELSRQTKYLPPEYADLIDNLTDVILSAARTEANYLYLCGFKDCLRLYKRLDDTFDESTDFENNFI